MEYLLLKWRGSNLRKEQRSKKTKQAKPAKPASQPTSNPNPEKKKKFRMTQNRKTNYITDNSEMMLRKPWNIYYGNGEATPANFVILMIK